MKTTNHIVSIGNSGHKTGAIIKIKRSRLKQLLSGVTVYPLPGRKLNRRDRAINWVNIRRSRLQALLKGGTE